MTDKMLRLLLKVAQRPNLDRQGLEDAVSSHAQYLSKARQHGWIVRTSEKRREETELKWEITGKGRSEIYDRIESISDYIPRSEISMSSGLDFHVYKPKHKRIEADVKREDNNV